MKKIFIVLTFLMCLLLPALALAESPQVTADHTSFNPLTGIYQLDGNVKVKLTDRSIYADHATVNLYQKKVDAQGHVHLEDAQIIFLCDQVKVIGDEDTAYCSGNCLFHEGTNRITSQQGTFNWDTKIATFSDKVNVNGEPRNGTVTFNVLTKQFQ